MISGKPFADLKAMADLNEPGELCMSGGEQRSKRGKRSETRSGEPGRGGGS